MLFDELHLLAKAQAVRILLYLKKPENFDCIFYGRLAEVIVGWRFGEMIFLFVKLILAEDYTRCKIILFMSCCMLRFGILAAFSCV